MELAQIVKILWDRKVWIAVAFVFACLAAVWTGYRIGPDGIHARSHSYGAAQTQFLVDSPRSSLVDITSDTDSLSRQAQLYTQFMRSNEVTDNIAEIAGVNPDQIVAQGPYMTAGGTQNIPRPAVVRSNEVRAEPILYRLVFDAQIGLPIVSVYAQAPTADEAIDLANASVEGIQQAVAKLETNEFIPTSDRTEIRELGPAVGGTVNPGVDPIIAGLAFIAVLILACALIVLVVTLRTGFRNLRAQAEKTSLPPRASNGSSGSPGANPRRMRQMLPSRSKPGRHGDVAAKAIAVHKDDGAETQPRDLVNDAIDRLVREGIVDEGTAGLWKDTIAEEEPLPSATK